jgi:putative glutamine amidotransferase
MSKRVAITFGNVKKLGPYEEALRAAGIEPVRNPESMAGLDGLVLTGGTDVNPALYQEEPHPETQPPDIPRDELERKLLLEALDLDRPVLAICRGMQIFNVVHGGSLIQHLPAHEIRTPDASLDAHTVKIDPGSKLAAITGQTSKVVNSRHHQAIARLGEKLVRSAVAPDGVIEGVERPDKRFAVAVQWHPEDRVTSDPADRALFETFSSALEHTLKE